MNKQKRHGIPGLCIPIQLEAQYYRCEVFHRRTATVYGYGSAQRFQQRCQQQPSCDITPSGNGAQLANVSKPQRKR